MERKYVDLHIHTRYSDGEFNPKQILEFSALNGIDILAITDHDNLRGYFEARGTAEKYGITLIPGVEITTPKYHLLGLNFNPYDQNLNKFVEHSREIQAKLCKKRIEILNDAGIPIEFREFEADFPNTRIGKGNIKNYFTSNETCRTYLKRKHPDLSPNEIYLFYLGRKGIASNLEPKDGVDPKEAIDAIHQAGGIIGIAHPPKDIERMEELEILVEQGLDFLEVQPNLKATYPYQIYEDFARENGLPVSFGSDYHGPTMNARPMIGRGENILKKDLAKLLFKEN
jgi:predicted metal-dependent phosphoesterase TrpH